MSIQYPPFQIIIRRSNGPKGRGKTAYNVYQRICFSTAVPWQIGNGLQSFLFPVREIVFAHQKVRESGGSSGPYHLKNIEIKGGDERQVFLLNNFLQSQDIACHPRRYSVETRELAASAAGALKKNFRTQGVPSEILSCFGLLEERSTGPSQAPPPQDFQI